MTYGKIQPRTSGPSVLSSCFSFYLANLFVHLRLPCITALSLSHPPGHVTLPDRSIYRNDVKKSLFVPWTVKLNHPRQSCILMSFQFKYFLKMNYNRSFSLYYIYFFISIFAYICIFLYKYICETSNLIRNKRR